MCSDSSKLVACLATPDQSDSFLSRVSYSTLKFFYEVGFCFRAIPLVVKSL